MTTVKVNEFYHNMNEALKHVGQSYEQLDRVFLTGRDGKLYIQTTDRLVMATAVIDAPGIADTTVNVGATQIKQALAMLRVSGRARKTDASPLEVTLDAEALTIEGVPPMKSEDHALTPKALSKIVRDLVINDVSVTFPAERIGGPKGWSVVVYPTGEHLSPLVTFCNKAPLNVWVYGQCSKMPTGKRNELSNIADALKGEQ
ncbi:hypothetical protein [Corynebacterium heidelbergense]|uniref:Uncharacterized protein n=1 Tax=Corynebacterium heidelbergense TaxID=2055947 RepID=A0A364VE27_9CORY|nr:hypothetical protein [Corynebacterium heidelbergense]RAV34899.1 hypothetical protein CWC39_00740 [Corynebacterium heidelbergense]WCZ36034.1 hypothetical protein CHEID_02335 [Corynebacterium heidelbergense]